VLRATTREIGEIVAEQLERASFTPARSNCGEIAQSVVQQFGGRQQQIALSASLHQRRDAGVGGSARLARAAATMSAMMRRRSPPGLR